MKGDQSMKRLCKVCGSVVFLGLILLTGGCGGGSGGGSSTPQVVSVTSDAISGVTVNSSGTITTSSSTATTVSAPAGATATVAKVAVSLPPATNITAKDATGNVIKLTQAATFTFKAPINATTSTSGTSGIPLPVTGGYTIVKSTSVAIDVQITGAASASFSNPITITLPVPGKAPGSVVTAVYQNKNDGAGYSKLPGGPYTVSANGTIDITVSGLCWFVGDPEFELASGSTGSSGSTIN
jgi:hypothetical protein